MRKAIAALLLICSASTARAGFYDDFWETAKKIPDPPKAAAAPEKPMTTADAIILSNRRNPRQNQTAIQQRVITR